MSFAATWMDLEIIIPSEASLTEKDKYYMASLINGTKEKTKEDSLFGRSSLKGFGSRRSGLKSWIYS